MSHENTNEDEAIVFDNSSLNGSIHFPDEGDESPRVATYWKDPEDPDDSDDEEEDLSRSLTPRELLDEGMKFAAPPPETNRRGCYAPEGKFVRNVLWGTAGLAVLYFFIALIVSRPGEKGFYHTEGTDIVGPDNAPFIARGIVLSGWLVPDAEELRLNDVHPRDLNAPSDIQKNVERLLGNAKDAEAFWSAFHENYVTANDIASFSAQGFNAVRVPFNYRLVSPEGYPGKYDEKGFKVLDKVIRWCKANNLAVLLDMHACPGGQSHDHHADPEYFYWYQDPEQNNEWEERGVQVLWEKNADYEHKTSRTPEFNQKRTAEIWREIARRYKNEHSILGYELANAPYFFESSGVTNDDLRNFYMAITEAVREVDTNHIVFVEGNNFAEDIGGLLPPWDDNMAIAFHRYWRKTSYKNGKVQEYLDARAEHQVPFLLTESGENSNPWIYEMARLMEENGIGWFYKGFKRVQSITAALSVEIPPDYQYVIDIWRDSPDVDHKRVKKGLMDLAEALKSQNCRAQRGIFDAMLDPEFNSASKPFAENTLPGLVQSVNFDLGNQGVAYSDSRYKQENTKGKPWNSGWMYRNDGVDIYRSKDKGVWSNGYYVSNTVDGEWLLYTVNVQETGSYRVSFRLQPTQKSSQVGELQLLDGDVVLANEVKVTTVHSGKYVSGNWHTQGASDAFQLNAGKHTLKLNVVKGGFDIGWMNFHKVEDSS